LGSRLSIEEVLAKLEKEMAFHKEQAEHHAEREAFHRERCAAHTAEHETIARHFEAFRASAGAAAEIAARVSAAEPPPPKPEPPPPPPAPVTPKQPHKLVARLVAELPAGETFTPSRIAAEVNRRYPGELKMPLSVPSASTILRRMVDSRRLRLVQPGTAHKQAVYARG
jgi:hypothetical protein